MILVTAGTGFIEQLMPDVLEGAIQPGRVFDRTISPEMAPERRHDAEAQAWKQ